MSFLFRLFISLQVLLLSTCNGSYANVHAETSHRTNVALQTNSHQGDIMTPEHISAARAFSSVIKKEKAVLDNDDNTDESGPSKKQIKADNYFYTLFSASCHEHCFFYPKDYLQKSRYFFYSYCPTYIMLRVIRI